MKANTGKLLEIFATHGVSATFFPLGRMAERYPGLVKRIRLGGHQVACHGCGHKLVHQLTPNEFRLDVRRTKRLLKDQTEAEVVGYRAPSFSNLKSTLWARDVLA